MHRFVGPLLLSFIVAAPVWAQSFRRAASMHVARTGHRATLLSDGRVLVSGGAGVNGQAVPQAEIFNPATGTWSDTAGNKSPRLDHAAILLRDGRVLVVGGAFSDAACNPNPTAEIYSPSAGAWSPTSDLPLILGRGVIAVLARDGAVTVSGNDGCGDSASESAVFNSTTNTWSLAADAPDVAVAQPILRVGATATPVSDGKMLVAGGRSASGSVVPWAELVDPAAATVSPIGSLNVARAGHTATRLRNGNVLIAGGTDPSAPLSSTEIYVPDIPFEATTSCLVRLYGNLQAVATNSKHHIVLLHPHAADGKRIVEYARRPAPPPECWWPVKEFGAGVDALTHAIRVDRDDNVWTVDNAAHEVIKFDPDGRVLLVVGSRAPASDPVDAAPPQVLLGPTDVTWDPAGNIFVSDAGTSIRIVKYDGNGRFIDAVGTPGSALGQMKKPHSIAADANGHVYVADGGNARIQVFDNALRAREVYDAIGSPWAICITTGAHQFLYSASNAGRSDTVSGRDVGEIYKMELDGAIVGVFGRADNPLGTFLTPHAIDCRQDSELILVGISDSMKSIKLRQ